MTLKVKRLSEKAVLPIRAHISDAGYDLTATRITTEINECGQLTLVYHTDIAIELPEGYFAVVVSRSSIAKKSIYLTNCIGVIDNGYRGEIMGKFRSTTDVVPAVYKEGERFAQLIILPMLTFDVEEVETLTETDRGEGGYGSTNEVVSAATAPVDYQESSNDILDDTVHSAEDLQDATEQAADSMSGSEVAE